MEAQKSLDHLLKCPGLRCVLDSFSEGLSKKSRQDIYVFLKDKGAPRVVRACSAKERPRKMAANEVCFQVLFPDKARVRILWKNDHGHWKLSNAEKHASEI